MENVYIHYGSDFYFPSLVISNKEAEFNQTMGRSTKPGGLWGSPEDSEEWGWKYWCLGEEFNLERLDKSFRFKLKENAKVLHVYTLMDTKPFIVRTEFGFEALDLKKLYDSYDAIELHLSNDNWNELHNYSMIFYTWDVSSICIWNPDVIEVVEDET